MKEACLQKLEFLLKKIVPATEKAFPEKMFSLKRNNNTLKCQIKKPDHCISFVKPDSVGEFLGFSSKLLIPGRCPHPTCLWTSTKFAHYLHWLQPYNRGFLQQLTRIIREFAVHYKPEFSVEETPNNLIYPLLYASIQPLCQESDTKNISLKILNRNFYIMNFRGEDIIVT